MTDLKTIGLVLNSRVPAIVRIKNGSLDESELRGGSIVMRGAVSPETLRFLKVDRDYQRKLENRPDIFEALKAGTVLPDIDVGVRGQSFESEGGDTLIKSPAYIIDGAQRVGTALAVIDQNPSIEVRIGALVHFSTTQAWEAQRFTDLNTNTRKVSASLHLRNLRDANAAVLTLYGLCHNDPGFVLRNRVSWEQSMQRGDLISAYLLGRVASRLHGHKSPGDGGRGVSRLAESLDRAAANISLQRFRQNVLTFFSVVNECWGLREIEYKRAAPHAKAGFLLVLARVFSRHSDFWQNDGRVLTVDAGLRRKLQSFPLNDPNIAALAGSAGSGLEILYELILKHINSGKREHRLVSRYE